MKNTNKDKEALLPKLARKVGEKSVSAASVWWTINHKCQSQ